MRQLNSILHIFLQITQFGMYIALTLIPQLTLYDWKKSPILLFTNHFHFNILSYQLSSISTIYLNHNITNSFVLYQIIPLVEMSILSKFFEKRHKKQSHQQKDQTNQQIVSIFNTPTKTININIHKKNQNLRKNKKQENEAANYQQNLQEEPQQEIQQERSQKQKVPKTKKIKKFQPIKSEKFTKKQNKTEIKSSQQRQKQIALEQNQGKINTEKSEIPQHPQQQQPTHQQPQDLTSTIFVGNIPLSSTHKSIKKYFEKYGKVLNVWFRSIPVQQSKIPKKGLYILKKYQEGADSMNAYVKFQQQQHSNLACQQANGAQIEGYNIKVTKCNEQDIDYETTIFIGNLPRKIKDQQLWNIFKNIGNVKSVRVVRNKQTLQGIGIGFVRFSTKQQMKNAIKEKNGIQIAGRKIRIKKAVTKQKILKKIKKISEKKKNNKSMNLHEKNNFKSFKKKPIHKQNKSIFFNNNQNKKNYTNYTNHIIDENITNKNTNTKKHNVGQQNKQSNSVHRAKFKSL